VISSSGGKVRGKRADTSFCKCQKSRPGTFYCLKAHHLSYAIENKIKRNFQGVTDVVVHLEPLEEKKRDFLT
jgi:divalent metal cation (Fe/Co/Zn/Cd) transporter